MMDERDDCASYLVHLGSERLCARVDVMIAQSGRVCVCCLVWWLKMSWFFC